jgi:enoyl-CoA hydratase/carnithine racemase
MIDDPRIVLERDGHVATLRLNRPEAHNAVSFEMLQALDAALDDLAATPPRLVVLSAVDPGFCAGIDLKESRETTPEFARTRVTTMHRVLGKLRGLPVPVIGALNGVCAGLGCEIAISADIRLAAPAARFSYPEPRVAVPSPTHHLISLIGLGRAQEMLLSARWVDALEAQQTGLVTRIVDDIEQAVVAEVERYLSLSPLSLRRTKENILTALHEGAAAADARHIEGVVEASATQDRKEALAAFAEKRAPNFTGR